MLNPLPERSSMMGSVGQGGGGGRSRPSGRERADDLTQTFRCC
jgi:hypothetical protein